MALDYQTDENGHCYCDGGGSLAHYPSVKCTVYHPAIVDELYDFRAPAVDNLTKKCPACMANGFNRIWDCGSMIVDGTFQKGKDCRATVVHVKSIGADDEND